MTTNLKTTIAALKALVPHFKFVCAEHGNVCDPKLTSDDLLTLVTHIEELEGKPNGPKTLSRCLGCGEEHLNYIPHRCGVCPGPCSVCEGSSHHWMEHQDEEYDTLFWWHCKHCPHKVEFMAVEKHPSGCDCPCCLEAQESK